MLGLFAPPPTIPRPKSSRIEGLPGVITHLAYAPDGRHLAAVLGGANGLRVYETETYREVGARHHLRRPCHVGRI